MDRLVLVAATLCFLFSSGYTLYALGAGRFRPGRANFVALLGAFGFLTGFLYARGQAVGACPLSTLFDVFVFLSWSLVLTYLVVGPAYRLSLLGAFTAPLALLLVLAGLVMPYDPNPPRLNLTPWVEFHAAVSIIAYGAFGLACIAGVMYLLQERQLKRHKISPLLLNLPPINDLALANSRLIAFGFILLTISFAAGFLSQMPVNTLKFWTSAVIWLVYGIIIALHGMRSLASHRLAELSIAVFSLALITLPGIQYLSSRP